MAAFPCDLDSLMSDFFAVVCVSSRPRWPAVCWESAYLVTCVYLAELTTFIKCSIWLNLQRKQCPFTNETRWSKTVPTLWRSFPFLATLGFYFLSGLGGVFRHSACALIDAVMIQLQPGGVRGEKPLKSRSAFPETTEKKK